MATVNEVNYVDKSNVNSFTGVSSANIDEIDGVEWAWQGGDRGLFPGGWDSLDTYLNTIDYITISTTGNATNFGDLTETRRNQGATSNGGTGRGVFGGGSKGSTSWEDTIDYVTIISAGNATYFGDLTASRRLVEATSNGTSDRGVFAGGIVGGTYYNIIDYITISSTGNATNFGDLNNEVISPAGTSNATGDRGVFAGGSPDGGTSVINVIDYITISSAGNATNFGDMTITRYSTSSCSNGTSNRGCFAGGYTVGSARTNVIDYITISSAGNATDFGDLIGGANDIRAPMAGTSNGGGQRGVFGGGTSIGVGVENKIDYITITTPGNSTDFGDLTSDRTHMLQGTSNA